jgi:hypothetical protein
MTSQPSEPGSDVGSDADSPAGVPGGDLGVGGPADQAGPADEARTPPGYPEEVDPSKGPLAGRDDSALGDLEQPGASR